MQKYLDCWERGHGWWVGGWTEAAIRIGGRPWNLGEVNVTISRRIGEKRRNFEGDVGVRLDY